MREIDIKEVKKNLSRLIHEAVLGESFVITVDGKPMVKVVALKAPSAQTDIPQK
jgi:antitoxin (DNA-binding transcriptional repressor) of toxin-antitoxin stability system